jgi:DNA-binding NtrC family response regulator
MGRTAVWIVESDHWPRAYLRAELIERGYDAEGFVTLTELLVRLALAPARPGLVVIDLQGQEWNDRQLQSLVGADLPVIAMGGATEWEDERLRTRRWARFLRRPLTIGAIADEVERSLPDPRRPGDARQRLRGGA